MTQFIQSVMTRVQVVEPKQNEFIKIGDIVCIEFIEQTFDVLKEYAKIDEGKDILRLAKILENLTLNIKELSTLMVLSIKNSR